MADQISIGKHPFIDKTDIGEFLLHFFYPRIMSTKHNDSFIGSVWENEFCSPCRLIKQIVLLIKQKFSKVMKFLGIIRCLLGKRFIPVMCGLHFPS